MYQTPGALLIFRQILFFYPHSGLLPFIKGMFHFLYAGNVIRCIQHVLTGRIARQNDFQLIRLVFQKIQYRLLIQQTGADGIDRLIQKQDIIPFPDRFFSSGVI